MYSILLVYALSPLLLLSSATHFVLFIFLNIILRLQDGFNFHGFHFLISKMYLSIVLGLLFFCPKLQQYML